jgi:hypothetical protein
MDSLLLELLARCGASNVGEVLACYAVSEAEASRIPVIFKSAELIENGTCPKVIVSAADAGVGKNPALPDQPANGYEGGDVWVANLKSMCVPDSKIDMMYGARVNGSYEAKDFNTLTEMCALVRHLRTAGDRRVILVAPDFHLPRVMVSFVTALLTQPGEAIWAWGCPVSVKNWDAQLVHSQGSLAGTVAEIFSAECSKIAGPKRFGNLATLDKVLWYLNERDALFI